MSSHQIRSVAVVALVAFAGAFSTAPAAGQVSFRLIPVSGPYFGAHGITEGSPDVLYSVGGGQQTYVFSFTPKGTSTQVAALSPGYLAGWVVSASNERFYGTEEQFAGGKRANRRGDCGPRIEIRTFQ